MNRIQGVKCVKKCWRRFLQSVTADSKSVSFTFISSHYICCSQHIPIFVCKANLYILSCWWKYFVCSLLLSYHLWKMNHSFQGDVMIKRWPEALQTIKSIVNYRYTTIYYTTGIRCYYCFNLWHISVTGSDRTGAPHKTHYGQHTYNTLFAQPCLQYLQYLQYFTSYHWLSACHLKNFKVVLLLTGSICWIMFVK